MKKPDDYGGPEVEIVQKDSKTENLGEFIDNLLTTNTKSGNNVAMFKKNDQEDGDLTKMLIERVKANNLKLTEMQEFMDKVNRVKIYEEIQNVKIAARFTEWSFKKLIGELEDCMQNDIKVKHRKIGGNFEKLLDSPEKMGSFMKQHGVTDSQLLEFPLPVLIQSGEHFNLNKFQSVDCDDNKLDANTIYINICAKYTDMQAMASRTLLINPTDKQKAAYMLAFDA